jgi:hypothetical protein
MIIPWDETSYALSIEVNICPFCIPVGYYPAHMQLAFLNPLKV